MTEFASNVQRMRFFVAQVQEKGRFELIDELVHPGFRNHMTEPAHGEGPEAARAAMTGLHAAFSDLSVEILHCLGEGDLVATHKVFRGVHTGEWFGVPPSGRRVELPTMDLVRYRDGLMYEHWAVADGLGLLRQTGATP